MTFLSESPSSIIMKRGDLYQLGDAEGIFTLYDQASEFRMFFPEKKIYENHFSKLNSERTLKNIEIVSEKIKGTMAEILYIETFEEESAKITFYSKTYMKLIDEQWFITKEKREIMPIK